MGDRRDKGKDRPLILFLGGMLLLASPLWDWVVSMQQWYLPYALWGGLIAATAWTYRRGGADDD